MSSKSSRTCKRVRLYLDESDPRDQLLARCLAALDDLSAKDRNEWFVNALLGYQKALIGDDSPTSDMTILRHRLMATVLEGEGVDMSALAASATVSSETRLRPEAKPRPRPEVVAPDPIAKPEVVVEQIGPQPAPSLEQQAQPPAESASQVESSVAESDSKPKSPLMTRLASMM